MITGSLTTAMVMGALPGDVALAYPQTVSIPAATAPANPPAKFVIDTGFNATGTSPLTISATGLAQYGHEGDPSCQGYPQTDPNGNRYLNGLICRPKFDPGALLPSAPIGALVADIVPPVNPPGDPCPQPPPATGWFLVGASYSQPAPISGRLYLLYNDQLGAYGDNSGAYTATLPAKTEATMLAQSIDDTPAITLATSHDSGIPDLATASDNIEQTAAGGQASRSCYGTAPGGAVFLQANMLSGMYSLATSSTTGGFTFTVSEIAGGSHTSESSWHYQGRAFDVSVIDGVPVSSDPPTVTQFMADCTALGATQVLDETTHIHCGWPLG